MRCLFILASLLCLCPCYADTEIPEKELDALIEKVRTDWGVPGMAFALVSPDKVLYAKGFGLRDVEKKLPVTTKTLFAIGSCTKAFTSFLLGTLVDEGALDFDVPVSEYIDGFSLYTDCAENNATARDLLAHRTGIARHDGVWYKSLLSRQELVQRLAFLQNSASLRQSWIYNNLTYVAAGYLAESLCGTSWEQLTQERIFKPLGMNSSCFSVDIMQRSSDFAHPYANKNGHPEKIAFCNIDNIGPAGSINSNLEDMIKWVQMQMNGGDLNGKALIQTQTLEQMHRPQIIIPPIPRVGLDEPQYGLGWVLEAFQGTTKIQHEGAIDGFSSLVSFSPKLGLGMIILTNKEVSPCNYNLHRQALDMIMKLRGKDWSQEALSDFNKKATGAKEAAKKKELFRKAHSFPSHPLKDYVGLYFDPGYGTMAIVKDDQGLKLRYNSIESRLSHWHFDVFSCQNALRSTLANNKVQFLLDQAGDIEALRIPMEITVDDIIFKRSPDPLLIDPEYLERLTGTFDKDGSAVKVYRQGSELKMLMYLPIETTFQLIPTHDNIFKLKEASGFRVQFVFGPSEKAESILFDEPTGVYTATRK